MHGDDSTTKEQASTVREESRPEPGILVTFVAGAPHFRVWPVGKTPLIVGRGATSQFVLADERLSRQHFSVAYEQGVWSVAELGSRNATYVDGKRIDRTWSGRGARTVRAGQTVLFLEEDLQRLGHPHRLTDEKVIVGPSLETALARVAQGARDGQNVLVVGETGVGKELAARTFHEAVRRTGPFRALNCAAVTEHLLESELFGHARGAFSGAAQARIGLFEAAHGGTLFLDELGEMPLAMQAKLLRVVQERQVRRVGENDVRSVDVRLVAATNRDLPARIREGLFRDDLYFRIAESIVPIPALRARPEEVPYLVRRALRESTDLVVDASLIDACLVRAWPGNVRELLGAVRSAAGAARLEGLRVVSAGHLLAQAWVGEGQADEAESADETNAAPARADVPDTVRVVRTMSRQEREVKILEAVRANPGADVTSVAVAFGVNPATVYRILQRAKRGE